MKCRSVQRLLRDGRDETRGAALDAALGAHLGTCAGCAALARDLELLHAMVKELPAAEPSAAFDWRLRLRLAKADAGEIPPLFDEQPAEPRSWWQFGVSAAAAAILVVMAGQLYQTDDDVALPGPPASRGLAAAPSGAGRVFPVSDGRFYGPQPPPSYSYFMEDGKASVADTGATAAPDTAPTGSAR